MSTRNLPPFSHSANPAPGDLFAGEQKPSRMHYPPIITWSEEGLEAYSEAVSLSGTIPECFTREEKRRRSMRVLSLLRVAHPSPEDFK